MPLRIAKSGASIATFRIIDIDSDAFTFLTAAGITNTTQRNAINKLVIDLKYYNLWTKMKALYPVVGGVAASHAVNLKTPGTYNLSFTAGWTHSSTGMTPLNAYADTGLVPSTVLTIASTSLSFYSRTNSTGTFADIGSGNNSTSIGYLQILCKWSDNKFYAELNDNDFTDNTVTDSLGFFIGSRTSSTNVKTFKNSNIITTKTTATSTFRTGNSITIGARNLQNGGISNYSNRQCAFASIGDGLTDQDALNFYNIVQQYQTNLSRQV